MINAFIAQRIEELISITTADNDFHWLAGYNSKADLSVRAFMSYNFERYHVSLDITNGKDVMDNPAKLYRIEFKKTEDTDPALIVITGCMSEQNVIAYRVKRLYSILKFYLRHSMN